MNGKGDKPRPMQITEAEWVSNWEAIYGPCEPNEELKAAKSLREAVQMEISDRIYTSYELEQLKEKK